MISQARQLPASERGALLRAAEEKLRASMRAPGTATTDRLRDLVIDHHPLAGGASKKAAKP